MTRDPDVIVVGGGPSGASAACALALAGRAVLVLERESGPHHKVCGEFVSAEAADHLRALGLDPEAVGAIPIDGVRLATAKRGMRTALPFPAYGLSRRRLDALLLDRAAALGATVRHGSAVRTIAPAASPGGPCAVRLADGSHLTARAVFLATGKHDLRGWERPGPVPTDGGLIGLKMHFRLTDNAIAALGHDVELHLFDGFYAGLQRVEGGSANLCLLCPAPLYRAAGQWDGLLDELMARAPLLAARLRDAEPLWTRPLAVARVPYGFVHRPVAMQSGIWRLGDQAAVTPSFTGDGLAIALETGRMAARALLAGGAADTYHIALRGPVRRQVRHAGLLARALLSPSLQAPAIGLARRFPALVRTGARITRLAT